MCFKCLKIYCCQLRARKDVNEADENYQGIIDSSYISYVCLAIKFIDR